MHKGKATREEIKRERLREKKPRGSERKGKRSKDTVNMHGRN
jgi:hypothetical protein